MSWIVRANFDERPWWVVRYSMQMIVARPLSSLLLIMLLLVVAYAYYAWPGLMAAFGIVTPIFAAMMVAYSFARLPGMDVHEIEPVETKTMQ